MSARICASGQPVLRAIEWATGRAATLVQPVRPAWAIATKFHFAIWGLGQHRALSQRRGTSETGNRTSG